MKKIVITSGFFNPLHSGHINLFRESKKLGDCLVVIVNNDEQVKIKGSEPFMTEKERIEIIKSLKYVDDVLLSIDRDTGWQHKTLTALAEKYNDSELILTKGGDRNMDNLPKTEKEVCKKYNIQLVANVGGVKTQSSSWLIESVKKYKTL